MGRANLFNRVFDGLQGLFIHLAVDQGLYFVLSLRIHKIVWMGQDAEIKRINRL